ncbi:MFS transporter [Nocardioides insulae]|uniref:MFS transporter n=1 Tax=Nocardioides insulae TaxID=394734 RepID=UPI0003FDEE98|nr:MFS transporter [Nocardioides insulae]
MNLQQRISDAPMTGYQWMVVALCVLLNCLDGFDVMAIAFTSHSVTEEFGLSGSELGWLISTGLIGMAIGSMVIAPYADVIGRRPLVLISLTLAAVGMLIGAAAPSALVLGASRAITGLGVGGILASTNVIASEYSSTRSRGLAIGLYTAGYGIGATFGGIAARAMLDDIGWRGVFLAGGIGTVVALLLLFALLPESLAFLQQRRPRRALQRINTTLTRLGQPVITAADLDAYAASTSGASVERVSPLTLVTGALRRRTVLLWVSFVAIMFGFYFVNSWTPQLLITSGMSEADSVTAGMMLALGGTVGSVLYGVATTRTSPQNVLIGFAILSGLAMVLFITTTSHLTVALAIGVLVGALINGCVGGLYTVGPTLYNARTRSTGMGWALGMGRIGAIMSPVLAGWLLDNGWSAVQLYVAAAIVVAASAFAVAGLRGVSATEDEDVPAEAVATS